MLLLIPVGDLLENLLNPLLLRVCGYSLVVLMVLPVVFLSKRTDKSEANFDEHDKLICKRALIIALLAVFGLLSIVYLIALFTLGEKTLIPVGILPEVVYGAFIVFIIVLSAAVLLQYPRTSKGEKS
jgi:hypothetical protein